MSAAHSVLEPLFALRLLYKCTEREGSLTSGRRNAYSSSVQIFLLLLNIPIIIGFQENWMIRQCTVHHELCKGFALFILHKRIIFYNTKKNV